MNVTFKRNVITPSSPSEQNNIIPQEVWSQDSKDVWLQARGLQGIFFMSLLRQLCECSNSEVSQLQVIDPAEARLDNNSLCHYLILWWLQLLSQNRKLCP
jgi:hypothetical protein